MAVTYRHNWDRPATRRAILAGGVVAAAGGCVPMISGRGLGHTGGTLDKYPGRVGDSPLIGAGTGGGDDDTVQSVIEAELKDVDFDGDCVLVRYRKPNAR